jgi:hypothetical protein
MFLLIVSWAEKEAEPASKKISKKEIVRIGSPDTSTLS